MIVVTLVAIGKSGAAVEPDSIKASLKASNNGNNFEDASA